VTALLFCFALWLGYLALEAFRLHCWREAIPLRIAVTGTRGKSSVVRTLATVLREDGWTVLAKSTGAEAAMILPDGSALRIRRRGRPSILEQVGAVGFAARLGADALVAEVMSVHPENHLAESRRILKPHLVLVTNFRVDHLEAHGSTKEAVAGVMALDVPPGARVLVPEGEWEEVFSELVRKQGGTLTMVPTGEQVRWEGGHGWGPNLDLVRAAARLLDVEEGAIEKGIRGVRQDLGALGCWRYPGEGDGSSWQVVNAFAVNDPESTFLAYDGILGGEGEEGAEASGKPVGLLSLRGDRGDRSLLWAETLAEGALSRFSRLYVHGLHANAVVRMIRSLGGPEVGVVPHSKPGKVMRRVMGGGDPEGREAPGAGGVLFGFGNLGGLGERMVRHWMEVGEPLPLESPGRPPALKDEAAVAGDHNQGGHHGI